MGKLALLVAVAAVFGGTLLAYSARNLSFETEEMQRLSQGDLLAREAAAAGQSFVLSNIITATGLNTSEPYPVGIAQPLPDGQGEFVLTEYTPIDSAASPTGEPRIRLTVLGRYTSPGGVVSEHTIRGLYEWDPFAWPSTIWFDTPFVTANVDPSATITDGGSNFVSLLDSRPFFGLRLDMVFDDPNINNDNPFQDSLFVPLRDELLPAVLRTPNTQEVLEDLNVRDAVVLQARIANANDGTVSGDDTFPLSQDLIGGTLWNYMGGDAHKIVHVQGDLTIRPDARVIGNGVLLVDGHLNVEADTSGSLSDGELSWDGLVMVNGPTVDSLNVFLEGNVTIRGGLVIAHRMVAPGGHMDVTVHQDTDGFGGNPMGNFETTLPVVWSPHDLTHPVGQQRADFLDDLPWFQHTHKYDSISVNVTPYNNIPSDGRQIHFRSGASATDHEDLTGFEHVLQELLQTDLDTIAIRFGNVGGGEFTGDAEFFMNVGGAVADTTVANGFTDTAIGAGVNSFTSPIFNIAQLEELRVHVRSLRLLRPLFDDNAPCTGAFISCPIFLGNDGGRGGALVVRIMSADESTGTRGQVLYGATIYWHQNADEFAQYQAESETIRQQFRNSGSMGTHFSLGAGARIDYNNNLIVPDLRRRLGFDPDEPVHVATRTNHERTN